MTCKEFRSYYPHPYNKKKKREQKTEKLTNILGLEEDWSHKANHHCGIWKHANMDTHTKISLPGAEGAGAIIW